MKILEMREIHRRKWCLSSKLTPISAATNCKLPNLVHNQSLDKFVLFCYLVSKLSNLKGMHINETIRNESKTCRIKEGRHLQNFDYLSC